MTGTVLEVLASIKAAVDAHSSPELPFELLDGFERQLADFEPFQSVHYGWARTKGGGRTGKLLSSHWAWRQFRAGSEPEAVLAAAQDQVAQNKYELLEIRPIYGLKIARRFDLGPDAYICPIDELPESNNFRMAFVAPTYAGLPPMRHDGSALVFNVMIDPAIVPTKIEQISDPGAGDRAKTSFLVKHALPLLTDGPIEMPSEYTDMASDTLLGGSGGTFIGGGQPKGKTLSWLHDLSELPGLTRSIDATASDAIILSIDRLMTSRLRDRLEDRVLDLGVAVEIALMHEPSGTGDGKGEITAKISSRGAWLLGQEGAQRLAISKELKALYGARSKVVHTGRSDGKMKDLLPAFDKLVVRILREILRREKFPDWASLVLGAD